MKLIQVNVWGGRMKPQILEFVEKYNPDILCLQEVIDLEGEGEGIFASLNDIKLSMGAEYSFMSPVFTINHTNRKDHFGNAILSKYPIVKKETTFTGKEYKDNFNFIDHDYNIRNLQIAKIELPEKTINVMNHHGHHVPEHKNGDKETMKQCAMIADAIKSTGDNIVLTGDFNLAPNSESLKQINNLLINHSIDNNLTTTRNELTPKNEVCDYIFTSKDLAVKEFRLLDDVVSDHCALLLEI